jgi:hypothetical protein
MTSLYYVSPLLMHGSLFLFALHNLICADLRPEPVIVTIRCASFNACAGIGPVISNNLSPIITSVMIFVTFINL